MTCLVRKRPFFRKRVKRQKVDIIEILYDAISSALIRNHGPEPRFIARAVYNRLRKEKVLKNVTTRGYKR